MKNVFDATNFPEEHRLVEEMSDGIQLNFPEVLNGKQCSLIMLPDNVFHYGKGKDQIIIHIQLIKDKIKALEKQIDADQKMNPTPSTLEEKEKQDLNVLEKEHMKNLVDGLMTEEAEGLIYHRFEELLHDNIGFLIHGYLPETYLKTITTRAKQQRKNLVQKMKRSQCLQNEFVEFTKLESKLQDVLGLTRIIADEANLLFCEVKKLHPGVTDVTAEMLQNRIKSLTKRLTQLRWI